MPYWILARQREGYEEAEMRLVSSFGRWTVVAFLLLLAFSACGSSAPTN
jgi:zinc D-Ala-D-Ala dipeptidase